MSGGHFGQIQGAIAHIDSSGCRRRLRGGDAASSLYRCGSAPCYVPTLPPPSAVPHGLWWLRLDCIEQSPGLFDPWQGEARGSTLFARLYYRCCAAQTSRPPLSRGSKCPGDTSVKSKARQRTLILLAAAGDWGVETLGDGVSLRIRSNTSCLLSQRYRSLQRSHPSVICFANATSP